MALGKFLSFSGPWPGKRCSLSSQVSFGNICTPDLGSFQQTGPMCLKCNLNSSCLSLLLSSPPAKGAFPPLALHLLSPTPVHLSLFRAQLKGHLRRPSLSSPRLNNGQVMYWVTPVHLSHFQPQQNPVLGNIFFAYLCTHSIPQYTAGSKGPSLPCSLLDPKNLIFICNF